MGYQGISVRRDLSAGSRWYFYPAALLCKLPIAMLLLLAAAVASKVAPRGAAPPARGAGEWSIFFALVVFAVGVMGFGDLNIGTRYLLPAFPLAIVFILVARLWSIDRPAKVKTAAKAVMPYLRDALLVMFGGGNAAGLSAIFDVRQLRGGGAFEWMAIAQRFGF